MKLPKTTKNKIVLLLSLLKTIDDSNRFAPPYITYAAGRSHPGIIDNVAVNIKPVIAQLRQ